MQVIDAQGRTLMPGMIDDQLHFMGKHTHKGSIGGNQLQ